MEAASIPETQVGSPRSGPLKFLNDNILWVLLGAALLVFFVQDPKQTLDDVKTGLSNGTIWALIALGYTLVYGIIELINFAHGEVFMIGSFVAVSIWATLGVDRRERAAARRWRRCSSAWPSRWARAACST